MARTVVDITRATYYTKSQCDAGGGNRPSMPLRRPSELSGMHKERLEYWEHAPDGSVTHFSWVTDLPVDDSNLMSLMRGARARWKIENETFNTLKNQGDHFEHHFGHGNQHLSTVLMHLMMLAFLIDQIQQRCCRLFQAALTAAKSKTRLWRKLRNRFDLCLIPDWETLYHSTIRPPQIALGHDTS
jgi:hypothetical protein